MAQMMGMTLEVFFRISVLALLSSLSLKRRRVMQWVREMMLDLPPTFWMMMRARPSYLLAMIRPSFFWIFYKPNAL